MKFLSNTPGETRPASANGNDRGSYVSRTISLLSGATFLRVMISYGPGFADVLRRASRAEGHPDRECRRRIVNNYLVSPSSS